jgi:hypothetical protein
VHAGASSYLSGVTANGIAWSGFGNVRILNLYTVNSPRTEYQDQLIMIPLPPGTGMAGTGLACMAGVGIVQRRRRQRV